MEQIRSADVLANFPQVDEEKLNAVLAAEAAASNRKILSWTTTLPAYRRYMISMFIQIGRQKACARALRAGKLFFILTNSRGFTVAETTKAHRRDRGEHGQGGPRVSAWTYLIISRGRLHLPRPLPAGDRSAARGDGG